MAPRSLTPSEERAIAWRYQLGPGGITRAAGLMGYSTQHVSHLFKGRKVNPTAMAYIAGMVAEDWRLVRQLVSPRLPADVRRWWQAQAKQAYAAGRAFEPFPVSTVHAEYVDRVRAVTEAFWELHVPGPATPVEPRLTPPPVAAKRRRPEAARRAQLGATDPSSGGTTGNGPRRVPENPSEAAGAALGGETPGAETLVV